MPEGAGLTGVSTAAGELAADAEKKRNAAETGNLADAAKNGQRPAGMFQPPPDNTPNHPKPQPAGMYDLASRALRTVSGATSPTSQAIALATVAAPEIMGPAMIAHGSYNALKHAPGAFAGNPEEAEASLGGASEAVGGGAVTGGAVTTRPTLRESLAESTTGKAVKPVTDIAQSAINRLRTPPAQEALTQAAQPGVRIPKAQESIAIAGPRIQQIRQAQGVEIPAKGPEALRAVLDLNKEAKTQILQAIEDRMGPVADLRPDASTVAKGIRGSVDDLTIEQTPGLRESMERRAATYEKEGGWSIRQMEDRMHTLNNRLANAYSQPTPGEAHISAQTEMDLAEARELRKLIDSSVEKLSGAGVKDLKREYGAQRDLEKSLARQYAIATRQKGAPLWEGLAYLQAAGDVMSGNVLGAAKAAGTLMVGKRLQMLRDSGYLANQAFHGPKAFEAAPPIPAHAGPPKPAGLLPAPGTPAGYTPPPDTSGPVRGGRYTTPKAQIEGEKPIEAEFVPRRVPTPPGRFGANRMLPESTARQTNVPPAVSPEFAREAIAAANPDRLGRTGEAGVRVSPGSRELPAPREGPATPSANALPTPKITNEMGIRWAHSADGKYRVSIPKRISDAELPAYAAQKLAEQKVIHEGMPKGASQ